MMPSIEDLAWISANSLIIMLGITLLFISKVLRDVFTSYKLNDELTEKDNPAVGIATVGFLLGVVIVYIGCMAGNDPVGMPIFSELIANIAIDFSYALAGTLGLLIGSAVLDRIVLNQFSLSREIVEDRNVGAGALEAGYMIATALVIAGALNGYGSPLTALVFFVIGQLLLVVFSQLYKLFVGYKIFDEIKSDNTAAGVVFGLNVIAFGIVLLKATEGDFVSWSSNLGFFGIYAIGGSILLLVLRVLADKVLMPKSTIRHEIAVDRNLNAAVIEGGIAIGISALICVLM
ncbi:DUF350 domain-containing protein [Planctomycetota bacterium]|nr:DUF350 domain-containing protein [Planctomycetota bacterium]